MPLSVGTICPTGSFSSGKQRARTKKREFKGVTHLSHKQTPRSFVYTAISSTCILFTEQRCEQLIDSMMRVRTFNWCKRRSEIVQVMEEDLVAVGARRNAGNVAVGFTAYPFRRVGLLEQLKHINDQ